MSSTRLAPIRRSKCATCPFRKRSPYRYLVDELTASALSEASRICHSTGSDSGIYGDTGKPDRLCRGARDVQLGVFHGLGFISEPTDEAWDEKVKEMKIHNQTS